jgi:endonuclease/exonuclease/phosphatase family metal-dependent hydrolase
MKLKAVSLNVGRGLKHLDKSVHFLRTCGADVICLQDVQKRHIERLIGPEYITHHFHPMTNHLVRNRERSLVGIGIFSRHPMRSKSIHAYLGNAEPILDMEGIDVNDAGESMNHDLTKVRSTESRLALFAEVVINHTAYKIGTTHGTWVKGGVADAVQRATMQHLACIMREQGEFVMAGDFNFGRDGEIYKIIVDHGRIKDRVPREIDNTLDPENHSLKGEIKVVSDYFITGGTRFGVSDVKVIFGVSDHGALSGVVTRNE